MSIKTITLKTQNGQSFNVEERVAMEFDEFANSLTTIPTPQTIPSPFPMSLKNNSPKSSNTSRATSGSKEESEKYNEEFFKEMSNEDFKEVILAANHLNIKYLLELLCEAAAGRIRNRTVEFVRKFFGIENDFTLDEEQKIRNDNAWAFEGVEPDSDSD